MLGGYFIGKFALANRSHKIAYGFHGLQAIAMTAYGVIIIFIAKDLPMFILIASIYAIFFSFFEFVFAFNVLMIKYKVNFYILATRFATGLISGLLGVILISNLLTESTAVYSIAVLAILGGSLWIAFAVGLKNQAAEQNS